MYWIEMIDWRRVRVWVKWLFFLAVVTPIIYSCGLWAADDLPDAPGAINDVSVFFERDIADYLDGVGLTVRFFYAPENKWYPVLDPEGSPFWIRNGDEQRFKISVWKLPDTPPGGETAPPDTFMDVNGDGQLGLPEIIYSLQVLAGIRE